MIQVYTGNGKGKTSAALGLALRATGAGYKVYIGQFIKGRENSELKALRQLKNITLEQYGRGQFINKVISQNDIVLARQGLSRVKKIIAKKYFKIIILDEINLALHYKLLHIEDVINLLKKTPKNIELILTGRYAQKRILAIADLVSEIKEVKHYLKKGILARRGIEY